MIGINKVCGDVVDHLRLTGKQVFSANDIQHALLEAGRADSSFVNYMGTGGHLAERGYLHRRKGGWRLTESSKANGMIVIKIMPANPILMGEIFSDVGKVCKKYDHIIETRMEV